jgi:Fe-S oxidoreductase
VIDPEVIWACTNCGACVNECPVDIEHIDHINGMRRHQVLVESAFPAEATTMLNNLERRGNPWGMAEDKRADWITELDFEVPVVDGTIPEDTEYLYWVGCAGALEDRARKATKATAELLHAAGVKFAVLGPAEACTGDPARRLGNEFVFQMLAAQNVQTLNEAGVGEGSGKKVIASCPHCFNTISREYPQLGGNYEVIHHTQLLARLVSAGTTRSTPRPGRSSTPSPAPRPRKCTAAKAKDSAAGPAAPGCGWRKEPASGSTRNASTRPWPWTPTPSPPPAPTAWSCSATPWPPRKQPARPKKPSKSSTSPSS